MGGATDSDGFSQAAATPELRRAFVASCVDLFIRGNLPAGEFADVSGPGVAAGLFDGIDIDWEVPGVPAAPGVTWSPADKANYPLLLQEFRDQLDAVERTTGRDSLLTAAVPVYAPIVDAGFDVPAIVPLLDLIFLMTYDLHGPFDGTGHTDHNAPLHFDPSSPGQEPGLSVAAGVATWQTRGRRTPGWCSACPSTDASTYKLGRVAAASTSPMTTRHWADRTGTTSPRHTTIWSTAAR